MLEVIKLFCKKKKKRKKEKKKDDIGKPSHLKRKRPCLSLYGLFGCTKKTKKKKETARSCGNVSQNLDIELNFVLIYILFLW